MHLQITNQGHQVYNKKLRSKFLTLFVFASKGNVIVAKGSVRNKKTSELFMVGKRSANKVNNLHLSSSLQELSRLGLCLIHFFVVQQIS